MEAWETKCLQQQKKTRLEEKELVQTVKRIIKTLEKEQLDKQHRDREVQAKIAAAYKAENQEVLQKRAQAILREIDEA